MYQALRLIIAVAAGWLGWSVSYFILWLIDYGSWKEKWKDELGHIPEDYEPSGYVWHVPVVLCILLALGAWTGIAALRQAVRDWDERTRLPLQ